MYLCKTFVAYLLWTIIIQEMWEDKSPDSYQVLFNRIISVDHWWSSRNITAKCKQNCAQIFTGIGKESVLSMSDFHLCSSNKVAVPASTSRARWTPDKVILQDKRRVIYLNWRF